MRAPGENLLLFHLQPSQSLWQQVRWKVHRGSYKAIKSSGAQDDSENTNDVSDNVEDLESV